MVIDVESKADKTSNDGRFKFLDKSFVAGDASEPRYDEESMAKKGIVVVTVNYPLGVFGFLALPELSKEAAYKASGNYGLLDQNATLKWCKKYHNFLR